MMKKALHMIAVLGAISIVSGGSLASVYIITEPIIEKRHIEEIQNIALQVLPNAVFELGEAALEGRIPDRLVGKDKSGNILGVVYVAKGRGYGGWINVVVGIRKDGTVTGVRIAQHRETPGLGSGVTEASFLKQFINRSVKDFTSGRFEVDAITGATISSRAVASAVKAAAERFSSETFAESAQ